MKNNLERCRKEIFKYKEKEYTGYLLSYHLATCDTDYCRDESYVLLCPELNAIFAMYTYKTRGGHYEENVELIWNFEDSNNTITDSKNENNN